jgi:hypothetical protein
MLARAPRTLIAMDSADPHLIALEAAEAAQPDGTAADASPALRDARRISDRVAADEMAADEARRRHRSEGLPVLTTDDTGTPELRSGELLHASRAHGLLEIAPADGEMPRDGAVYLTSERLLHVAAGQATEWRLGDLDEMLVALERLLLIRLRDGSDITLEIDHPRLFRVELAAAVVAARERVGV